MKYKKLGRTDIDVSLICLGTMTWGQQNTEIEGHEQMDYALSRGVNFFDTAELYSVPPKAETYGRTEEIIGTWFSSRKNREKVILATKIAGPGPEWIRGADHKIDRKNILEAVEGSLKRLRTDYIDLYQLHWPNRGSYHFSQHWNFDPSGMNREKETANFIEVLETFDGLIKQGKIRHIGLSDESVWGAMHYLKLSETHNLPRMVSIQNEYSLLCRLFEPEFAETAHMEDIGLLAWSPLATGLLTGKYIDGARPKGSRWELFGPSARDTDAANKAAKAYVEVANDHGLDPAQMALSFVNSRPFVTSNIIGATSMAQLKTNIDSVEIGLGQDVLNDIDLVRKQYPIPY